MHVTDVHENAAPIFQSDGNLSIPENQTIVYDFNATDPDGNSLVYSILYGDDANAFDLNATGGILSFIIPPDYENPGDNNTDNIYEVTIEVSDGSAADYLNLYIHVQDVFEVPENNAPFFQTGGILSILENESFVFEFNATDQDGDLLTYSILYGDDMQWFELNTITGTLGFLTPRDFESGR